VNGWIEVGTTEKDERSTQGRRSSNVQGIDYKKTQDKSGDILMSIDFF
jgi:hypothetical protein